MDGFSSSVKLSVNNFRYMNALREHVSLPFIETSVLLTALLFVLRFILDLFRRRSSSRYLGFLLFMLSSLPYAWLATTIGLMQPTKSNNDVYQVWAVVLITLKYSIRTARPTGIYGKQNPLEDMIVSLWAANLLGTRTTLLKIPLWLLWSLNCVRIILGFADTELTSSSHRRDLRLLTEYMRTEHKHPLKDCDAKDMTGYKYLVWGEDKQKIKSDPPEYRVQLEVTQEKKFITTDKVWEQNGALLGEPKESNELKDLCLAFALFKLLRRRFFGLPMYEANQPKTKELVLKGLIQKNKHDRAFQIIEAELAFLNDYFFTRFAVMFARGFPVLRLVVSLSVIGVASYLAGIFYHSRDRLASDLSKTTNAIAVTWLLLFMLTMKEIWEMVSYVMSDWTKVVFTSDYVQQPWWTKCPLVVALVKLLCKYKIAKRWHGILWQYNLLQSCRCNPWHGILHGILQFCRDMPLLYPLFTLFSCVFKSTPGFKTNPSITHLEEVKVAICESLQYLCEYNEPLKNYFSTAAKNHQDIEQKISPLIPSKFAAETQKILVWHIATCYCEIKLAKRLKFDENRPTSTSFITSPFLLENLDSLDEGLRSHYKVATTLSQYSAHLLTRRPPLVPGRRLVSTEIFRSTTRRTKIHVSSKSWEDVLLTLDTLADENDDNDDKDGASQKGVRGTMRFARSLKRKIEAKRGTMILKDGVRLGRSLSKEIESDTERWKFFEKFWVGYLIYLASSVSPDGHKKSLSGGGEFLTHVWALLLHAGVLGKTVQARLSAMGDLEESVEINRQEEY